MNVPVLTIFVLKKVIDNQIKMTLLKNIQKCGR